jgi:hypothetical protein
MVLRDSPHKGDATFARVLEWARQARVKADELHQPNKSKPEQEYRAEFIELVERAMSLSSQN